MRDALRDGLSGDIKEFRDGCDISLNFADAEVRSDDEGVAFRQCADQTLGTPVV
jgi:hypothetical protein